VKRGLMAVLACLLIVLVVLVVLGCSVQAGWVPSRGRANFAVGIGQRQFTYVADKDAAVVRLHLELRVTKGEVAYELVDPSGAVRWEGEAASGEDVLRLVDYASIPGRWTLRMAFDGAKGYYAYGFVGQ